VARELSEGARGEHFVRVFLSASACVDVDFAHLAGVHTFDMRGCNQAGITDAAFAHLAGVHTLYMSGCT